MSEIEKALKRMSRDKALSKDGLCIDLMKDVDFLLDTLAELLTKCLQTCSLLRTCKNATRNLIH